METYNVKKNHHILYKLYIFKTWATLKLKKNQRQKSEQVVFQILGWYDISKNELSVRFCLGTVPNASTRAQPDSITPHIRAPPFPYVFWVIWTIIYTISYNLWSRNPIQIVWEVWQILLWIQPLRNIKRTHMCIIARWHITKAEFIFQTFYSKIIEWMLSFELLAWKQTEVSTIAISK